MTAMYPQKGRDNNFQLVRLCAATAVVLTHSFSIVTGRFDSEPLVGSLQRSIGHYAVDVFFILSGFLVVQSLSRNPDITRYFFARGCRILPGLLAAILLTALVLGPAVTTWSLGGYFFDPDIARYVFGAISTIWVDGTLPGVFVGLPEAGKVNEPLWTLKYEVAAYASLAIFFVLARRLGNGGVFFALLSAPAALAVLMVYLIANSQLPWTQFGAGIGNLLHLMPVFYFGVAAFLLRRFIPLTLPGLAAVWGLAILTHTTPFRDVTELVVIGYTFLWVAFVPNLARKSLERLGDYSFGIYIYAYPIQQALRQLFPQIEPLELFAAAMVCVLPVAIMSWHLVENPALAWGKAYLQRRRAIGTGSERSLAPLQAETTDA